VKINQKLTYALLIGVLLLSAGVSAITIYMYPTSEPVKMNDFSLTNIYGDEVNFSDADGKIRLVSWVYTQCIRGCATLTYELYFMLDIFKSMGISDQIMFYSIDFDYLFDNQTTLYDYATFLNYGNEPPSNFEFLWGEETEIIDVTDSWEYPLTLGDPNSIKPENVIYYCGGVYHSGQVDVVWLHSFEVFLIDHNGFLIEKFSGLSFDSARVYNQIIDLVDQIN
jgi:cytochrome oxidase Cu insertion factor (SCO1/SenC/PrrC family)